MYTHRLAILGLLVIGLAPLQATAAEPFDDMLRRIPDQANAILLIDLQPIRNSPYGIKHKLGLKNERDYTSGATRLPPWCTRLVVASQLNPATLENAWEIVLGQFSKATNLQGLLKVEGGAIDQIAGQDVLLTRRQSYAVPFGNKMLGVMRPADRQQTSRWIRSAKAPLGSRISPYLQQAASAISPGHPLVMAVDLTDVFDVDGVLERLRRSKALAGSNDIYLGQLAHAIGGVRGVRFTAGVDESLSGEIRIDFQEKMALYGKYAKPLVMWALDKMGAHVADLDEWTFTTDDRSFVLQGALTEPGLRQLVSPLLRQAAALEDPEESPGVQAVANPKAAPSQRYYRSISKLLDELQNQSSRSIQKIAYLMHKYAQSIDELPILNVDEELLKFGSGVSKVLRTMAGVSAGTHSLIQLQESLKTEGFSSYWNSYAGPYGGYGYYPGGIAYTNNYAATAQVQRQAEASDVQSRIDGFQIINNAMSEIRKKMVQKYNVEF